MRILLVEDSNFFGKLVSKRIKAELGFHVRWLETYDDAARHLDNESTDYFLALLDLNLPDAPIGQIVDLVLSKGIPAIVFTGGVDSKIRQKIWSKRIIDYVPKRDIQDVNYLIWLIKRLYQNRGVKVLVVDDSKTFRANILGLLQLHQYSLIEARDGMEAMKKIKAHPDIRMMITDYNMPNMDGFELIKEVRKLYDREDMAIIGISGQEDHVLAAQFIKNGTNDFVTKPFSAEEFYCRVTQNVEGIEHIIRRREAERALSLAKEQADQASKMKSEFLANMSHEIRTPMNAILGLTHLALKTALTKKQTDYLTKIQSSAQSLLGIINDILDFSKIEAGKLEIETADFDLEDVLENVSNLVSLKAEEKGLEIIFEIEEDIPRTLVGDPLRLGQILINLADNAIKFTEKGEVIVSARRLSEGVDGKENLVTLGFSVQDTGIGLDSEEISRLFQAFSQSDGSTTRKFGGTGLGLTISKRLVEKMGGEISVTSTPGSGSVFSFTARFGKHPDKKGTKLIMPVDLRGFHAMVVDDNATLRKTLCDALTSFSFDVCESDSGEEAQVILREMAKTHPCHMILMDWKIPGIDVPDLLRRIKEDPQIPKTAVILMVTAYGSEEVMLHSGDELAEGFLIKPISRSSLFDTIMDVFGHGAETRTGGPTRGGQNPEILRPVRGASILLVEDNKINQQVATELLENEGFVVTIAHNGREAVDKVLSTEGDTAFDIILMDLQMPEMDGFEATRAIREDPRFKNLPIVAMTAHAMVEEREKCLNAGMNDHATKPIEPALLFETLARWIRPTEGKVLFCSTPEAETVTEEPFPLHLPGIDIQTGLKRINGNRSLYKKLLHQFALEFGDAHDEMRRNLEKGDLESGQRLAHNLKGVSGNIGAGELYMVAKDFEHAFKHGDKSNFLDLAARLRTGLDEVLQSVLRLEGFDAQYEGGSHAALKPDIKSLLPHILTLQKDLKENNLIEDNLLAGLREFVGRTSHGKLMAVLEKHISEFDYDSAAEALDHLSHELGIHPGEGMSHAV